MLSFGGSKNWGRLKASSKGFSRKASKRSFHVEGPKTEKAREPSGESGTKNLEAESIRGRAESKGGCVKLKTVTEIRRSSARDTFIVESVDLVPLVRKPTIIEKKKKSANKTKRLFAQQ